MQNGDKLTIIARYIFLATVLVIMVFLGYQAYKFDNLYRKQKDIVNSKLYCPKIISKTCPKTECPATTPEPEAPPTSSSSSDYTPPSTTTEETTTTTEEVFPPPPPPTD